MSTILAAAPVTTSVAVVLDGVTGGRTMTLTDGRSVTFVVRPVPANLTTLLNRQLGADTHARVTRLPNEAAEIEIALPHPVTASRLETSPTGGRLIIDFEDRIDAIRRRALTPIPRSVPSVFVGPRVRDADAALTAGRYAEARQRFTGMTLEYSLRSWAELRLADLDLVGGDTEKACAGYRGVAAEFPQRTAGLVSRMRLAGLECVQKETVTIDWPNLVARLQRAEGPVGKYLLREGAWVLQLTRDPNVIRSALAVSTPGTRARLKASPQLRNALLARAVRHHGDPYQVTRTCFAYQRRITRHPENRALLLACARAALALDLADTAVTYLDQIGRTRAKGEPGAMWKAGRGDLQTLALLSRAYDAAGRTYLSRRAADRYAKLAGGSPVDHADAPSAALPPTEIARTVTALEARIGALREQLGSPK